MNFNKTRQIPKIYKQYRIIIEMAASLKSTKQKIIKFKSKQAQDAKKLQEIHSYINFQQEVQRMFGIQFEIQIERLYKTLIKNNFFIDSQTQRPQIKKAQIQSLISYFRTNITKVKNQININGEINQSDVFQTIQKQYKDVFPQKINGCSYLTQLLTPPGRSYYESRDYIVDGVRKYKNFHNQIIKSIKQISHLSDYGAWVIQNFLGLKVKNQKIKVILQLKNRLFNQNQRKRLLNLIEKSYSKIKKQQVKTQQFNIKVTNKSTLISNLQGLKILCNIFQLMKAALAGRFILKRQKTKIRDLQFRQQSNFLLRPSPTTIHLYLIFDNDVSQDQFESIYRLFRPILRYWFKQLGVILHVMGFGKNSLKNWKKKWQENRYKMSSNSKK